MASVTRSSLVDEARAAARGGPPAAGWDSLETPGGYQLGVPDEIRLRCYYPPTREMFETTPFLQEITWTHAVRTAYPTGTITFDNTDGETGSALMRPGTIAFLEARPVGGRFHEFERFLVYDTNATARTTGQVVAQIATPIRFMLHNEGNVRTWIYRKDKKHPKGWRADQIAADICRRLRCPVKSLVRGSYHIKRYVVRGSGFDALAHAYEIDQRKTGKHYFVDEDRGKLLVRRAKKRTTLLALEEDSGLRDHSFTRTLPSTWASQVIAKKTAKAARTKAKPNESKSEKKRREAAQRKVNSGLASQALFGTITYRPELNDYGDPDYSRDAAQALSDRLARTRKEFTCTADLNLLMDQGDRFMAKYTYGRSPTRRELFISQITKTITAEDRTMQLVCAWQEKEVDTATDVRVEPKQTSSSAGSEDLPGGDANSNQALGHQMMLEHGWGEEEWPALKALWEGESNWDHTARNPDSGAFGIPQSLPAEKMATAGSDWQTNPRTQIKWGLDYIKDTYGSPRAALAAWNSRSPHWY